MRAMRRTLALGTIALLAYRYFKGNGAHTTTKKAPTRSKSGGSRARTTKSPRSRAKSKTS